MSSVKGPLVGTLVCGGLTWVMWSTAVDAQAGIHKDYHGRRSGIKQLLASVAESLGPTGSLVVGGLLTLGMIGWLVYTLKQKGKAEQQPPAAP